jgi:hypothetical protein
MIEAQLSRGARDIRDRLRWYRQKYSGPIKPKQEKLGKKLGPSRRDGEGHVVRSDLSGSTVRKYLLELKRCCSYLCPDRCDGTAEHGHVGLIEVHQRGDGHTAEYIMNVRVGKQAERQAEKQAEIFEASQQPIADVVVTDENKQAEPTPVVFSSCSFGVEQSSREQHYSPLVNDAACAKSPPPDNQKPSPKPKPGSDAPLPFASEVAEIREALKARPLVRYHSRTFDPVIREMLASGKTVETIKRAILRGCWLKLAGRDRAAMMGVSDASLIFSMRYFLGVIDEVMLPVDAGYWRNLERRLRHEERQRINSGQELDNAGGKRLAARAG